MEGPFLDAKKKGAHVEGYIRKPDAGFFRELNEYSGNMVKLVTLAPNVDGAMAVSYTHLIWIMGNKIENEDLAEMQDPF